MGWTSYFSLLLKSPDGVLRLLPLFALFASLASVRAQTPTSCTLQNLLQNGCFGDGVPGVLPTGWTR